MGWWILQSELLEDLELLLVVLRRHVEHGIVHDSAVEGDLLILRQVDRLLQNRHQVHLLLLVAATATSLHSILIY